MKESESIQQEVEEIFILLSYALVYDDWQDQPQFKRRGYNVGALIVSPDNKPVYHGLNCIDSTNNVTQHGEIRAITEYLGQGEQYNLAHHSIYVTLEPCIMCAGMITMASVKQVVYGQSDVHYSHAFERISIDSTAIGGYAPYPRNVSVKSADTVFCNELNRAYKKYLEVENEKVLAKFLTSTTAKEIFKAATEAFLAFQPTYNANKQIQKEALKYYNNGRKQEKGKD
ncbi:MAG: nucleoside deaminase [Cyclobacteriaceae bacterium]